MTDQCKNCSLKGDIKKCLAATCFHHENWYAKEQQKRIEGLEAMLEFLVENDSLNDSSIEKEVIDLLKSK